MTKEADLSRWGFHCKWGRWAEVLAKKPTLPEALNVTSGLLSHAVSNRNRSSSSSSSSSQNLDVTGEMDPELWGQLQDYIDIEEMVFAKLPLHAFHRALSVCKKWNSLKQNQQFLERCSISSLPKPYFILYGPNQACHQAILVQDMEKWVLKPLPCFGFRQRLEADLQFSVAHGIVYTPAHLYQSAGGTVFDLHTKLLHRLPLFNFRPSLHGCVLAKLAVDKRSGSYKVLAIWCERGARSTCVYDSVTGEWTRNPTPSPKLVDNELESTYCEGVMYMKCGNARRFSRPPSRIRMPPPVEPRMFRTWRVDFSSISTWWAWSCTDALFSVSTDVRCIDAGARWVERRPAWFDAECRRRSSYVEVSASGSDLGWSGSHANSHAGVVPNWASSFAVVSARVFSGEDQNLVLRAVHPYIASWLSWNPRAGQICAVWHGTEVLGDSQCRQELDLQLSGVALETGCRSPASSLFSAYADLSSHIFVSELCFSPYHVGKEYVA